MFSASRNYFQFRIFYLTDTLGYIVQPCFSFIFWCVKQKLRSKESCICDVTSDMLSYSLEGLMMKLKLQYFGHLIQRNDSLEKTLMLGKRRQEEKGMTEDEMVGWHHWLNGQEFAQTLWDNEGHQQKVSTIDWLSKQRKPKIISTS